MKDIGSSTRDSDLRIAVVASRFNHFIVDQLVSGARDALERQGIGESNVVLAWVPGAFELPLLAERFAIVEKIPRGDCAGRRDPGWYAAFRIRGRGVRQGPHAGFAGPSVSR